ncbi:NAD(P)-dependent alcohol dehydrogenase [Corallococcus sp. CA047B]|nr:NAD(P)-dependent alcohol dehydrogenase [Corallococcus sp. CA047B]
MCTQCDDPRHVHHAAPPARRTILKAGLGLASASALAGTTASAQPAVPKAGRATQGPRTTRALGAAEAKGPLKALTIQRRAMGPNDVLLDVLYCGICHSDIHVARSDRARFPCVPGHEVVGRVQAVGSAVTRFKVGDVGGVGCMVGSCGECANCLADREQNCLKGTVFTYGAPDPAAGGYTFGGYSETMVVPERFVLRIPPGADLAATAPLLCAGVTTFSPLQHWEVSAGQRVGVVGLGGLGHIAVKLAVARRADVTVFTTSPGKVADSRRLGARHAVLSTDAAAMKEHAGTCDLLIATVPRTFDMRPFMDVLKLDGTLVNLGTLGALGSLDGLSMVIGRKSVAGSLIGGIAETQEMLDYCAARGIKADVEVVRAQDVNRAYDRIVNKDVRYRFVIDVASLKDAQG